MQESRSSVPDTFFFRRLCNRSRTVATHLASFSRAWTHSSETGATCRAGAWRKEASPASHDVLIRPAPGHVRIQPHQQVQMIVQDRKPRDGHREEFSKFLEPMFDLAFPVVHPFPSRKARRTQRVTE